MMVYSFLCRLAKASSVHSVQHVLNRLNVTLPVLTSRLHSHNNPVLIRIHKSTFIHLGVLNQSKHLHVGIQCKNKVAPKKQVISTSTAPPSGLSSAQKVKQAGRDFTYLIVVLVGLGVTGGLLYVVFQELFSSSSPNKVYGKAFKKCKSHPEVIGAFGEPIKCYGETTRRGRRQHVSHVEYMKDGQKHMRLKFYIEGSEPGLHGTVHAESYENAGTGTYEFRYLFVDVESYPRRTIVVEDNR